ncbi:MAG TPA: hypothetical protein VH475_12895 [Tepidisphaeraceae bacterium]
MESDTRIAPERLWLVTAIAAAVIILGGLLAFWLVRRFSRPMP